MPKLGEFIGALLADAVQARLQADLEVVKLAELYSRHELLQHLPVPRFRLPDITVDVPVLITAVDSVGTDGRSLDEPSATEIRKAVTAGLREASIRLPRGESARIQTATVERAAVLFTENPKALLTPARVARALSEAVVEEVKGVVDERGADRLEALGDATRSSMIVMLLTKLPQSPSLQVAVTAEEIRGHDHDDSLVHLKFTMLEDAYEVVAREDGEGYFLTPE